MSQNTVSNVNERIQLSVRFDGDLIKLLGEKRIELLARLGSIPSRSEVVRIALEEYLVDRK